jgi:choline dehydrogenase
MRVMLDLLRSPQLKPIVAGPLTQMPSEDELPAWLLANAQPAMHPSATCAMGPASDPNAVVDQEGRVHGVDGLRVVDASILPEVPRANLNATVMMLGERIATFL